MKNLLAALVVALSSVPSYAAGPYIQGLWDRGNPIYVSQGITAMPSTLAYDRSFTSVAVAYHPLSAGSIIPERFQGYLPPESWAFNLGGNYAPTNTAGGSGVVAGIGFNLLDSARAWASSLLQKSSNETLYGLGSQIAPSNGPANLFAGRAWEDTMAHPGRFAPRWQFAASFGF